LTLSVFESESGQKYENKCNIGDIRPYPIRFHPYYQGPDRDDFVHWLHNLHIDEEYNRMIVGDFNFFRSLYDRNRSGGNMNVVMIFNKVISNLGLLEIPQKGRKFTWSNMQDEHLLEQIDWVFTSVKCTTIKNGVASNIPNGPRN